MIKLLFLFNRDNRLNKFSEWYRLLLQMNIQTLATRPNIPIAAVIPVKMINTP